jgi:isopenicillin-N epimerase
MHQRSSIPQPTSRSFDPRAFRAQFPIDESQIYLNSGTHSICPTAILDSLDRNAREYERNPTQSLMAVPERLWEIQRRVALHFGADPKDFLLRPNVTAALNTFVLGIPLKQGSEILVSDLEYGAIAHLARFRAERGGLQFRTFHLPGRVEELRSVTSARLLEVVLGALSPKTSLLLLSHVATGNGLVLPILEIARETRKRGILLAVDGAHGPGFVPIDFSQYGDVDFYGGNLHKWMLGPKGTGFGWIPRRNQERLWPIQAGWTTFETPENFRAFGEGSRFQAAFMPLGCHDFSPYFALEELLDFWRRNDRGAIVERIGELQHEIEHEFGDQLGWEFASPSAASGARGPLLSYELPASLQDQALGLQKSLFDEYRVQVAVTQVQGRWVLRLSPHGYNTEDEIARAARIVGQAAHFFD